MSDTQTPVVKPTNTRDEAAKQYALKKWSCGETKRTYTENEIADGAMEDFRYGQADERARAQVLVDAINQMLDDDFNALEIGTAALKAYEKGES